MRMRKKKGWAVLLAAALLTGILSAGTLPVSKAEETSAPAGKYGLKNPVVKAVSPPENTSHGLSNPRNENGTVTWDCVEFGSYWQNDTNGDGVADKNDEKEPIKWRVLSVDGDDVFLLADTNLDVQCYNDTHEDVTWETCTMRSWLNGYGADENICGMDYSDNNFLDNAFTESEQAAIKDTDVVNEDNPEYGTEGGDDTVDKVYLLSIGEVTNLMYGFASAISSTNTRSVNNTEYVYAGGEIEADILNMIGASSKNGWWLRSTGHDSSYASYIYSGDVAYFKLRGCVNSNGYNVITSGVAVRPALHLNLSSSSVWQPAGEVTSEGGEMVSTWDCVYFGNYPQSDATGATSEPIKWRVLSVDGGDAFLLADTNLDVQKYNDTNASVTWKTCTMRTWLNSSFLNKAFSASEQAAIKDTTVVNEDDPEYGIEGGNDTKDKVYLLSISEVLKPGYGFSSTMYSTDTREAVNTAYVTAGGEIESSYMSDIGTIDEWWLRSPSVVGNCACEVGYGGAVSQGVDVDLNVVAVRPALHLNLSDTSVWSYAGTVSSTGEENEFPAPNPLVSPSPLETPAPSAGGSSVTVAPSAGQNPVVVYSSAPDRNIPVEAQEEVQKKNENPTLAKVTGLKLKAKKKAIQATWKKVSEVTGYEIQVSTSKKFKKKSTKTVKKTKFTINKLKPKTRYFIRVRAYNVTNGKKTYGKWSKVTSIKTKK